MTSSITSLGLATITQEAVAPGVRRSRFSFHINTPRRRRWLLVQVVSVPDDTVQRNEAELHHAICSNTPRLSLGRLIDEYRDAQTFNRCI